MCVSLAKAELSGTTVFTGYARVDEKLVHVGGYQNTVENRSHGGNAMILPVPSIVPMGPDNLLDTSGCKYVLKDIASAAFPSHGTRGGSMLTRGVQPKSVQVFDHDIYTIVLADDPRLVPDALGQVAPNKRPPLNTAIFDAYAQWYPGWKLMVCCFDNQQAAQANPFMWWYTPILPGILFAPGLDCHTGSVPDLRAMVARDHEVIFGGDEFVKGNKVYYRHSKGPINAYLPTHVGGRKMFHKDTNGDFYITLEGLHGDEMIKTISPPGSDLGRSHSLMAGFLDS